jgi:hypothetical protein
MSAGFHQGEAEEVEAGPVFWWPAVQQGAEQLVDGASAAAETVMAQSCQNAGRIRT